MAKHTLALVILFSLLFASAFDATKTSLPDTKGLLRSGPSPRGKGHSPQAHPAQTTKGLLRSEDSGPVTSGGPPKQTTKGLLRSEDSGPVTPGGPPKQTPKGVLRAETSEPVGGPPKQTPKGVLRAETSEPVGGPPKQTPKGVLRSEDSGPVTPGGPPKAPVKPNNAGRTKSLL